jgi:tRNA 2-thiouridine synthesizing protein A
MPVVEITQTVDARGLSCPMPIVKTAQAVKAIPSGAVVELFATDIGSIKDVAAWCRATGNELIERTADDAVYRFVIRRE